MTEPTTTVDPAVVALVDAEGAAQDLVSDNLVALILAMWGSFSAFYAGAEVAALGARLATYVIAAQRQAARITEAHLRQQLRQMAVELPSTTIVDLPRDLRLGAETADVYQRPVRQVRYLQSTGVPLAEAVETATERIEKLVLTDLQLARSTASQQILYAVPTETTSGTVTGYRRIIHPELGQVCGLCIAASDRVYRKKELLPLHPGCKCTTIPVVGVQDPGGWLNADDLERVYEQAGGTTSTEALRQTRWEIVQNGELGPILTPVGEKPRSARQVQNQLSDRAAAMRKAQLERQIEEMRPRAATSPWHKDRLEQLQELLAAA